MKRAEYCCSSSEEDCEGGREGGREGERESETEIVGSLKEHTLSFTYLRCRLILLIEHTPLKSLDGIASLPPF